MSKIYKILFLSLAIFVIGCSDDDDNNVQNLRVLQSDTEFASLGGNGKIEVSAVNAITVKSSEAWCKPSVAGNTINIAVDQNTDINGRHATISIESGNEKTSVTITQLGTTFIVDKTSLPLPLSGGSDIVNIQTEKPVTVKINPDDSWLTYEINNDVITFTATKSTVRRTSSVEIISGPLTKILNIEQTYRGYADFLGDYTFSAKNHSGAPVSWNIKLTQKVVGQTFKLDPIIIGGSIGAPIEVKFQPETNNLIIVGNQYMVTLVNNGQLDYVYLIAKSTDNYWTIGKYEYQGVYSLVNNAATFTFRDNGTWPDKTLHGFYVQGFFSQPPSVSPNNSTGAYTWYTDWVLTKQ